MRTCQAANTSDVSIENKTLIYQAANTFDIRIKKTSYVSVKQQINQISV